MNDLKHEEILEEQREHEAILKKLVVMDTSPFQFNEVDTIPESSPTAFDELSEQESFCLNKHGIVCKNAYVPGKSSLLN